MKRRIIFSIAAAMILGACGSNVKETLGLERTTPDEFSVVERAPLVVPPNFDLAPPQDGVAPPTQATQSAKSLVLGSQTSTGSTGSRAEQMLLQKAGTAAPNIRQELAVDTETAEPQTVAEKLGVTGTDGGKGKALNPKDEAQRLQQQNVKTVPIKPAPDKK